jgi:hypothetical protein
MAERIHTANFSKDEALHLYRKEILMYESVRPHPDGLPNAKELNDINAATQVEAHRRYDEIVKNPDERIDIAMYYDRPKDIINFSLRLGDDEEV